MNVKKISVLVAQFPITMDIRQNLDVIITLIPYAESGDLIILPEGALSGYSEDPAFLKKLSSSVLTKSLKYLQTVVVQKKVHIIFGSCIKADSEWYNTAIYFGPKNETFIYQKINLATCERGHFTAGSQLPFININVNEKNIRLGIQLCREIRFPEQWKYLAQSGAEFFVYLTNAIGDDTQAPIWRSHLISRAAENQRFVLCANNAQPEQKCPSMIVDPQGRVIWEVLSPKVEYIRCTIDLSQISNWYLNQSRDDIIRIEESEH